MNLPSKELLSEVLEDLYRERLVEVIHIEENTLQTFYDCGSGEPTCLGMEINIYELAHKCKEWAFEKGYVLETDCTGLVKIYVHGATYPILPTPFKNNAIYEPEAVFKACQWILDNKETK